MTRIWAALERIIPRGLLAGSTIAAAFVTDPYAIGVYTWAALALTLFSALTDTPIQHVAMISIGSPDGREFLRRYAFLASFAGVFFMAISIWLISYFASPHSVYTEFFRLSPFILAPIARSVAAQKTAVLQFRGLWRKVTESRFYGAIIGAAIGLPIVFIDKSILGACITVTASEICYTALVFAAVNRLQDGEEDKAPGQHANNASPHPSFNHKATYRHMVMFSTFGWLSGQAERVLLGAWAGTGALGTYSFGTAIGRSAGEAIAASQPGVLRADLTRADAHSAGEIRSILSRNLRGGLYLTAGNASAVILISIYVLPTFLADQWSSAIAMASILALSSIPSAVAQSTAPVFVQKQRAQLSYIAPAILLVFAPIVAIAAINSLTLAAWSVLLRECMLATIQSLLIGRATPWREVILAFLVVACGSVLVANLIA